MSHGLQIALALASVAILLGLMAVVRHLAGIWKIGSEVQRKLVHIGTGLYAITLPWLFPDRWPIYLLIGLTLIVMLVLRLPNSRLGGTLHGVERQSYGDLLLAISVGLCLFLAGDQLVLYVLPIAVLTLADAAAALAGSTYGTRFFQIEDGQKSLEGSAVFFAVTLLIAIMCLMLMTKLPPQNIIVLSAMVAGFGTLVEAVSWRGFDNMFLPMGLLIFLAVHATDPLHDLLILAAFFASCIIAFKVIAPKLGLTHHAARVYVTTVFLLLAVTDLQNAIFPILVLAAHAWARTATPCHANYPDLDIIAGLALISFGWLALGTATEQNAISFYGITSMGLMIGFSALAVIPQRPVARFAVVCAILLGAAYLRTTIISLNPDTTNWNGPMWGNILLSVLLMAGIPSFYPAVFAHSRVMKLTLMSLVIPLMTYLYATYL